MRQLERQRKEEQVIFGLAKISRRNTVRMASQRQGKHQRNMQQAFNSTMSPARQKLSIAERSMISTQKGNNPNMSQTRNTYQFATATTAKSTISNVTHEHTFGVNQFNLSKFGSESVPRYAIQTASTNPALVTTQQNTAWNTSDQWIQNNN